VLKILYFNIFTDPIVLIILTGIFLTAGFVSGIYPAIYLSSFSSATILRGEVTKGSKGTSFRKILVVFQFAISAALIMSLGIIHNQMNFLKDADLGFNKENVVVIKRGWAIGQKPDGTPQEPSGNITVMDAFKNDLLQNPEVVSVSGCGSLPGHGFQDGIFTAKELPGEEEYPMNFFRVDYDFAKTLKLEFLEGHFFQRDISSDRNGVVINEAVAQMLGYKKPYAGKRIGFTGDNDHFLNIIGVVKNFHYQSLHHKVQPLVIGLQTNSRMFIAVRIRPNSIPATVNFISKTWNDYIPYKPFEFYFFDQEYEKLYAEEQKTGKLFTMFSMLAIFIACLGLFGLASFTTAQRTKEIGIRKVLGAAVPNIIMKLSKDFTKWVLIANLVAWPAGWLFMNHWLSNFAYNTGINLWVFVLAAFSALLISLVTVSILTIRAALSNPVNSLRYE